MGKYSASTKIALTMKDMGMAYRKAKVDLYYSSTPDLLAILEYEKNLSENLEALRSKIQHGDDSFFSSPEFLGGWTVEPKAILGGESKNGFIHSDPKKQWETSKDQEEKHTAEFRLMASPSIDFVVLSTLWMMKVGKKYEAKLHESAYGNRLRRKKNGQINPFSLGSFQPYIFPYRQWRDRSIRAMEQALEEDKRFALKLKTRGISLICGVEYLHRGQKRVSNQIWSALTHDGLGFPSFIIYQQDKQHPALCEERTLKQIAGLSLKPVPSQKWTTPPVICHGGFYFSLLICSELTNIAYRTALRGKIDALFISEWNRDTQSFNSLVESAALDIHAYIIQCNDRVYGDSRIRAPYKNPWERDMIRLKGGLNDYFVVGKLDIHSLRAFQSTHRSPSTPFKPVPDGFKISHERKELPSGD